MIAAVWLAIQWLNAAGVITIAVLRITEWPRPQSSTQITGYDPSRSGVMCSVVWRPGTASCFCPNSGTQNEWITSLLEIVSITERSFGRRSTYDVRPCESGYVNVQANCTAVTLIAQRVVAGGAVAREDDGAHDRDRRHDHERDQRPGDLEAGVAVDRRPVVVVVRAARGT